jgi:hypothetical protein
VAGWEARTEQIAWVLVYADDLDADFLAHYGIDLEEDDISARRYLALAQRTFAYSGVMSARADAQREAEEAAPSTPAARPETRTEPQQYQSVAALAARYPDEIEIVRVEV